jgi:hypothetical protein
MGPNGENTFIKEDDQGEGWDCPLSAAEVEDESEAYFRKIEKFRRRIENKTVR